MAKPPLIAAILLAAGLSRRFGSGDKLAQIVAGKPLALHIAETLAAMDFATCIAVCSSGSGAVPEALSDLGFNIVLNPTPEAGQGSSLALSIRSALTAKADGALVTLADMPFISRVHLESMIARWQLDPDSTIASAAGSYLGPPVLLPNSRFAGLTALTGDRGARHLLAAAIPISASLDELRDFDTPGDFAGVHNVQF